MEERRNWRKEGTGGKKEWCRGGGGRRNGGTGFEELES
jgi:hypothetical protein